MTNIFWGLALAQDFESACFLKTSLLKWLEPGWVALLCSPIHHLFHFFRIWLGDLSPGASTTHCFAHMVYFHLMRVEVWGELQPQLSVN